MSFQPAWKKQHFYVVVTAAQVGPFLPSHLSSKEIPHRLFSSNVPSEGSLLHHEGTDAGHVTYRVCRIPGLISTRQVWEVLFVALNSER